MTTIGYGDVTPYTTAEFVCQLIVAICGSIMNAFLCAACIQFLQDLDSVGDALLKLKLRNVEKYISYRNLSPELGGLIRAHYAHVWKVNEDFGKEFMMDYLSLPIALDVAFHMNKSFMMSVPIFCSLRTSYVKRFALVLTPLSVAAGTFIYQTHDISYEVYFVSKGAINVQLPSATSTPGLSILDQSSLKLLRRKEMTVLRTSVHTEGTHFGEFSLVGKTNVRVDTCIAEKDTELFSLDRDNMWSVFTSMIDEDRWAFLVQLFTSVSGKSHTNYLLRNGIDTTNFRLLYRLAESVLDDIVDFNSANGDNGKYSNYDDDDASSDYCNEESQDDEEVEVEVEKLVVSSSIHML